MKKTIYNQEAVQGDVVITAIDMLPQNAKKKSYSNDRLILAEGENTGHAHAVYGDGAELWEDARNKDLYLVALKEVQVIHEEHRPVIIAPGTYKVFIVEEYDYFLEETRKVVD